MLSDISFRLIGFTVTRAIGRREEKLKVGHELITVLIVEIITIWAFALMVAIMLMIHCALKGVQVGSKASYILSFSFVHVHLSYR